MHRDLGAFGDTLTGVLHPLHGRLVGLLDRLLCAVSCLNHHGLAGLIDTLHNAANGMNHVFGKNTLLGTYSG